MQECISHTGLYDDDDNPLADDGSYYLPGVRSCGHRDCVNTKHIVGYVSKANNYIRPDGRRCNEIYSAEVVEQVIRFGSMPKGNEFLCAVEGCPRLHQARNLCQAHYGLFRRKHNEALRKQERLTLSDFPELPPATARQDRYIAQTKFTCLMPKCERPGTKRGLCKPHYQIHNRLTKENA